MNEQCPCVYPDPEDDNWMCACGHTLDEHDDGGQCQALNQ